METTMEFLTTRKSGRESHRHWPDEIKAQIVSESLRAGAKVMRSLNALDCGRTVCRLGGRWRGRASLFCLHLRMRWSLLR